MIVALTAGVPAKLDHTRGVLAIQNQGGANVRFGRTEAAVLAGDGQLLAPMGGYEFPDQTQDAGWSEIWVVSTAAGTVWHDRVGA